MSNLSGIYIQHTMRRKAVQLKDFQRILTYISQRDHESQLEQMVFPLLQVVHQVAIDGLLSQQQVNEHR